MNQHLGSFDVAQELQPEAVPKMGALNETRHVSHHVALEILQFHDTEVGFQSGEWIVSNLRSSRGNARNQSGFAYIGKPHQADVRQQLEFKPHIALYTAEAILKTPRS